MTKSSCITHPPKKAMVIVREHYVALCFNAPDPKCTAALLNLFTYWTDVKIAGAAQAKARNDVLEAGGQERTWDESLWIWKSTKDFQAELMSVWGKTKIEAARDFLIGSGCIEQRNNPDQAWDKTYQYLLNIDKVNQCIAQNQTLEVLKIDNRTLENSDAIPEITSKTTPKTKEKKSKISSAPESSAGETASDFDLIDEPSEPPTCPKCGGTNLEPFSIPGVAICVDCRDKAASGQPLTPVNSSPVFSQCNCPMCDEPMVWHTELPPNFTQVPQPSYVCIPCKIAHVPKDNDSLLPPKDDCPLPSMCEHYDAQDGCQRPDWDGCRREGCVAPPPSTELGLLDDTAERLEAETIAAWDKLDAEREVIATPGPPTPIEEVKSKPKAENPPRKLTDQQAMFGAIQRGFGFTVLAPQHKKDIGKAASQLIAMTDAQGNRAALPEHIQAFFMWAARPAQWWTLDKARKIVEYWPHFVKDMEEDFEGIPVYPPEPEPMEFPTDLSPEQIEKNKATILAAIQKAGNALSPNYVEPKTDERSER